MPNGAVEAITQATRLGEVGFPEFTAKLITDTMDAVVGAMLRQQEGYADLLAKISKTIEDFEADEVTDADVEKWLAENFPDPDASEDAPLEELTVIRKDTEYKAEPDEPPIKKTLDKELKEIGVKLPAGEKDNYTSGNLTEGDVTNIKKAVKRKLAKTRLTALQELVRMGMVRIVIDEGKIYTKLIFTTYGTQFQTRIERQYEKKAWGVGGRIGGVFSFVGGLFGISGGGSIREIKVKTVTQRDFTRTDTRVQIIGGTDISFRTDYEALTSP
jgi:hypothetical protein